MRRKLEEKRQERVAAVKALTPPTGRRARLEVHGNVRGDDEAAVVSSPRRVWGTPPAVEGPTPVLARQVDATGEIRGGGWGTCVYVCAHKHNNDG